MQIQFEKLNTLEQIITNYINLNFYISNIDKNLIDTISSIFKFEY
jgi:hypothetical protein